MPLSIWSMICRGKTPALSIRKPLSIVTICDTFATESFGRPDRFSGRNTLPGAWLSSKRLRQARPPDLAPAHYHVSSPMDAI